MRALTEFLRGDRLCCMGTAAAIYAAAFLLFALAPAALPQAWEQTGPDGGSFVGVFADPANANRVTAITTSPSPSNVYRSTDGGVSWTLIGSIPDSYIQDTAAFDFSRLYAVSIYGCYYSTDGGATWTLSMFPSGTGYGNCITPHPTDPNTVYAGGLNNGMVFYKSVDGGKTWTASNISSTYGVPYDIAISRTDPDVMYMCGYQQVATSYSAAMYKSTDGGASWTDISSSVETYPYQYLYSVAVDPLDNNYVYAGGYYFYRSTDGGVTWTKNMTTIYSSNSIGIDPVGTANLYMAGSNRIFVSKDRGQTWAYHDIAGSGKHVEVAPAQPSTIFVASMRGGLYRSDDSGATWSMSHAGISFCDIASLAVAPSRPETVLADIDGAYTLMGSSDCGDTWEEKGFPPTGCSGTFCDILISSKDPDLVLALESG